MKEELLWKLVQQQIGNYQFNNLDLLKQAFTRRSYTAENGGENNEVLEFIGDKALDYAVVRILTNHFGQVKTDKPSTFFSELNEGQLTQLKSRMVNKRTLARRIDELGFSEHLVMGKSDIANNIQREASVKEDLFEAIIGAVALDSDWDQKKIQGVVETMLVPDDFLHDDPNTNYVRLIQEWEMQKNGCIPWYKYREASYSSTLFSESNTVYQNLPTECDHSKIKYRCYLKLLDSLPVFCGFGASQREARMAVCREAYMYLNRKGMLFNIQDEIEEPSHDMAINQLEILARRGYFSIPSYEYTEEHDEDGKSVWKCECQIEEKEYTSECISSSKKDAKKGAAYDMLFYVLGMEE